MTFKVKYLCAFSYCVCLWTFDQVLVTLLFGPIGVRALPLAAGVNIFLVLFHYLLVVKIPEGVVVGFQIFAWAPN
jgi:hypothetical protein